MDQQELLQTIKTYADRDLEQRKNWYSPAAASYHQARPRYPQRLIEQVVAIANLSNHSRILEVGCGPGTATLGFAPLGCSMLCLEPNPDFCQLARDNCQHSLNIEIENTSFEEWTPQIGQFDAVLAASSFHWIPAEVGYPKAAQALKPGGCLILLWNKELQPSASIHQDFAKIYQAHAPELDRYEDRATQLQILQHLGQWMADSGHFGDVTSGHVESSVTYTAEQYLMLLQTYSPYLQLDSQRRVALFDELRQYIEDDLCDRLPLTYISAFQIAQKLITH